MRSQSGQELITAAMTLPVIVLVLIMSCWVFIWQLSAHTTQFVAQEAARAATQTSGLASDPDAVTSPSDSDDVTATEVNFIATQAQTAAQNAIDGSFLHGISAGGSCPTTPASGQVCFIQEPPCYQGSSGSNLCVNQGAPQCLTSTSRLQALWVCQWYEVPVSPSTTYKVKVVVVGWFDVGFSILGSDWPIIATDEESIQRCGGCPG
jgi:hypothetical protein